MTRIEKAYQEIKNLSVEKLKEIVAVGSKSSKTIDKDRARAARYALGESNHFNKPHKNNAQRPDPRTNTKIAFDQAPDFFKSCFEILGDDALCDGDLGCDDICTDQKFHFENHVKPSYDIHCSKCPSGKVAMKCENIKKQIIDQNLSDTKACDLMDSFLEELYKNAAKHELREEYL